ncbi:hypothetical protein EDM22_12395 [Agromyces tardus]|uniref:Uncharacterized protein n=1 Tax=Agromyces tardus TaxID=2583849 RepID=A0A3M8A850_9MICO|nr:hypothetical protein EDM22_12395 [Agromyces tardus]
MTVVLCLAVIGGAALLVAFTVGTGAAPDTLRFEVAKSSFQVFSVAVIGAVISLVTSYLQERQSDKRLSEAFARDLQAKEDDAVRDVLTNTIQSYNRVKRARRLMYAKTYDAGDGTMRLGVYDEYIDVLMNEQLEFERLKRMSRSVPLLSGVSIDIQGKKVPLHALFGSVEDYLNGVLDEYKTHRNTVALATDGASLHGLPATQRFLSGDDFWPRMADKVRNVEIALRGQLMRPDPRTGSGY